MRGSWMSMNVYRLYDYLRPCLTWRIMTAREYFNKAYHMHVNKVYHIHVNIVTRGLIVCLIGYQN